jgi:hypothetical protein
LCFDGPYFLQLKIQNYNFGKFRNLAELLNTQKMSSENAHGVQGEDIV